MGVLQFPTALAGSVNVFPTYKYMVTTDNLATVTIPGYLNVSNTDAAQPMARTDMVVGFYNYNLQTQSGTYGLFTVSVSNQGVITLGLTTIQPNTQEWTPTVTFQTPGDLQVNYGLRLGFYASVGSIALVTMVLGFSPTYTTASGNLIITGLPTLPAHGGFGAGFIQVANFPPGTTNLYFNANFAIGGIALFGIGPGVVGQQFTTTEIVSGAGPYNIQCTIPFFVG